MSSSYAVSVALAAPDGHTSPVVTAWARTEVARLRAIDPGDPRYPIARDLIVYWSRYLDEAGPAA